MAGVPINQVCIQAIGAGDIEIAFFAQDPTKYGYEQVTIWEGKFRSYASVRNSTRAWTTTITFGQPTIYDENGEEYKYRYPRTIMADIQKRPNLPPATPDEPDWTPLHLGAYFIGMSTDNFSDWTNFYEKAYNCFATIFMNASWLGKIQSGVKNYSGII